VSAHAPRAPQFGHRLVKPVLLGMNNPLSGRPDYALYPHPPGCTGHRLWKFSGLDQDVYLNEFERRNVLDGKAWSMPEARKVQARLRAEFTGRTVVILGSPVNSIMRGGTPHELAPPFSWTPDGAGGWRAKVPHPSGLNPFFNDALHKALLAVFMEELLEWSQTHEDPGPPAGVLPMAQADLFG
jgi:hypothetical protein